MMTIGQLIAKLGVYGDDTPICVRTFERGEICLTVDLTKVKVEGDQIVLIGDLDEAAGEVH